MSSHGKIHQINLSPGGVPKKPVLQAFVTINGLDGDKQIHTKVHGGPERALCLYSVERLLGLQEEGHPIFPGAAGENLTLRDLEWGLVAPGARLRLGESVLLEVTRYTTPCNTIAPFFLDGYFKRISQEVYPGWSRVYTKVLQSGIIQVGDSLVLES